MTTDKVLIAKQLNRLSMFGKLQPDEMAEYCRSLEGYSISSIVAGIDWIRDNYTGHYFPKPPEVREAIAKAATASRPQSHGYGECGTVESNAAFWKAFRLAGALNDDRRRYYWGIALGSDTPIVEGQKAVDYYECITRDIQAELGDAPKCSGGDEFVGMVTAGVSINDLPF